MSAQTASGQGNINPSVAALVNEKLNASPDAPATGDGPKKFIVNLSPASKVMLDKVAKVTRSGKINIASELIEVALTDAFNLCVQAGKIDSKGNIVGEKKAETKPEAPKA